MKIEKLTIIKYTALQADLADRELKLGRLFMETEKANHFSTI